MSSVTPSPLAPASLTLINDFVGTFSYCGFVRSNTLPDGSRRTAGLVGLVSPALIRVFLGAVVGHAAGLGFVGEGVGDGGTEDETEDGVTTGDFDSVTAGLLCDGVGELSVDAGGWIGGVGSGEIGAGSGAGGAGALQVSFLIIRSTV